MPAFRPHGCGRSMGAPQMKPETQINRRREEFPTLASGLHLLSHSLGPVPRAARESMLAYYDAWEHHTSEDAWATSWWEMSAQVVERAHRQGALVLLDVYQSAGAVELKASDWQVDFLIGGTIKWLCGGPACGYLYVRPDLQTDLQPRLTGWVAHAAPFDFAQPPMRYTDSVRRFAQGTPSIPALYSVLPGLQIIEEVGIKTIQAESRRRTEWMMDLALEHGWKVNSPRDVNERGGSVMIYVEDGPAMVKRLAERKVFVDCRTGVGLRMSPHFFNTDEEVREAMEILAELMRQ